MQHHPQPADRAPTDGKLLARNVVWNLIGQIAPLLAALLTIPPLIGQLGIERFGVLTLAWTVIGYFSLFDLGIGRAVTKVVAEKLGRGEHSAIPSIARTALTLMLGLGMAGGAVLAAIAPWLVGSVLNVSPSLQGEVTTALYLLAVAVPAVVVTSGLRGALEAYQRFALLNAIRVPIGIAMFVGPLAVAVFTNDLTLVVASLAVIRYVAWAVHWHWCRRVVDPGGASFDAAWGRALVQFGGWMTVTNVVGPLMVYLDRFLIGAMLSVAAVAYYVAPYEVVTKLWIIPGALIGVLFPAFAATFSHDKQRAAALVSSAVRYIFVALFPICFVIVAFAREALELWLGSAFAFNGARVLQWLTIGVFVNSIAYVPSSLIQGAGRPDVTAKLHLIELPCYLVILFLLTTAYGIEGAAMAWTARVLVDALVLGRISRQMLSNCITRVQILQMAGGFIVLLALLIPMQWNPWFKIIAAALCLLGYVVWAWIAVFDEHERMNLRLLLRYRP